MPGFFWNPAATDPNSVNGPQVLTEAQWRARLAQWVYTIDVLEVQLQANVGVQWLRAPDGDYWVDVNVAVPPAFTPTPSDAANPNMLSTDTTTWAANTPPGA
jgi:hypothetical protein